MISGHWDIRSGPLILCCSWLQGICVALGGGSAVSAEVWLVDSVLGVLFSCSYSS